MMNVWLHAARPRGREMVKAPSRGRRPMRSLRPSPKPSPTRYALRSCAFSFARTPASAVPSWMSYHWRSRPSRNTSRSSRKPGSSAAKSTGRGSATASSRSRFGASRILSAACEGRFLMFRISSIVDKRKEITMTVLHVFDPPMCCSTGVCGPSVDPQLVRFAADLDWLHSQGVTVERFNLSQQPGAFAGDAAVRAALEKDGEAALPLVKVDGEVKSSGAYPSRDDLAAWAGLEAPTPSIFTDAVAGAAGDASWRRYRSARSSIAFAGVSLTFWASVTAAHMSSRDTPSLRALS